MEWQDRYPIKATTTSFTILHALSERESAGVTELGKELDLSKGTVHKHLVTLSSLGYVKRDGDDYRLTLRPLGIGRRVRDRMELYRIAKGPIDNLVKTTGEVASLAVREHGYGVYVYLAEPTPGGSEHPFFEGARMYLHASAAGKALLAYLPRADVEAILDVRGTPSLTDRTISDRESLFAELRSVRDQGLAFDRGEHRSDWQCVAGPIVHDGQAVGSISVSGPTSRVSGKTLEEDIAGLVLSTTNAINLAAQS